MSGEFKNGTTVEKDEVVLLSEDEVGYTIDYIGDDDVVFEAVVVWGDEKLRNRIVELLNEHGA